MNDSLRGNSIHFLSDDEVARLSQFEFLHDYLRKKRKDLEEANAREVAVDGVVPDPRRLTNVGTFRAYVLHYLRAHPTIHQEMTLLVRQLQPGPKGLPLEIYCFSNDTNWANYEGLTADIFDHLIASLPGVRTPDLFRSRQAATSKPWRRRVIKAHRSD